MCRAVEVQVVTLLPFGSMYSTIPLLNSGWLWPTVESEICTACTATVVQQWHLNCNSQIRVYIVVTLPVPLVRLVRLYRNSDAIVMQQCCLTPKAALWYNLSSLAFLA